MDKLTSAGSRTASIITTGAIIGTLLIGCSAAGPLPEQSEAPVGSRPGLTFALIGDLGYEPEEEVRVDRVYADLNRDTALAFVVHVGDLSAPVYSCTNELRSHRLAQFQASVHPFVFTPGDNDWTDCHEPAVKGGNPLERLADLRRVFFAGDQTLGQRRFALVRQSEGPNPAFVKYRENVRWDLAGVTFLTLHIPGSNNGLGRNPTEDAEYAERNQANLAWLRQGFEHAKASNSRAVMIMQQANVFPDFSPIPEKPVVPSGYTDIREQLRKETLAFGKPVILVHGDSHYFRIDKPLSPLRERNKPLNTAFENFTRVETFGSPYNHWVHVTIDANDPNVFSFRQRIVETNLTPQQ